MGWDIVSGMLCVIILYALLYPSRRVGLAGVPTPLDKVNVAGQRDREVQSFMAPPQSYDTTRVT